MKKHVARWFAKAQEDELSAESILKHRDGSPSTVCFLSQQIAEKYLKGFLAFSDQRTPKLHDLPELSTIIEKFEPEVNNFTQELDLLSGYYIEARYPGDYPQFSWKDAEEAFEAAERVKSFILKKIK